MSFALYHKLGLKQLLAAVLVSSSLVSCNAPLPGTSSTEAAPGSGKGSVVLFITDNISFYKQVVVTVTGVKLVNSGTSDVCTILSTPVTLDVSNLSQTAHYAGLAACPSGKYNRVDVEVEKNVYLMDQTGATSSCAFTAYLDESNAASPLSCDQATNRCTVSMRGGSADGSVVVGEDQYNDLGVDFDLQRFTVSDFGNPSACAATMAVLSQSVADMNNSGRSRSVTGAIANLDASAGTFTLMATGATLTVDYSGVLPSLQPGLDTLLTTAQSEGLRVNVLTGTIDLASGAIAANRLAVKAAGTATGIQNQPVWSFILAFGSSGVLPGSHKPPADVQGDFVDCVWVDVKFDGYDSAAGEYLASAIEVLPSGIVLDD